MTDSPYVLAGILIVIVAIVGAIAATIVRTRNEKSSDKPNEPDVSKPVEDLWARLVATEEGRLDVRDRLDMVARLEMVGEKWCVDALRSATHEEHDPQVNAAVRATLTRLHAYPTVSC